LKDRKVKCPFCGQQLRLTEEWRRSFGLDKPCYFMSCPCQLNASLEEKSSKVFIAVFDRVECLICQRSQRCEGVPRRHVD